MTINQSPSSPSVGFWDKAAHRAQAVAGVLWGAGDSGSAVGPEWAFYKLEALLNPAVVKLQKSRDAEGYLDVRRGSILSLYEGGKALQLEIGDYSRDPHLVTVRITNRTESMASVWVAFKVPAIGGLLWWIPDFSLKEPTSSWPDMEEPSEA